jgi:uroporphyrinogen decarboxylase
MNSRERMLAAIRHQPVDRVPTDIWATPEVWRRLQEHAAGRDLSELLHLDGMPGVGARYVGPPPPPAPAGEEANFWGMRYRRVDYGSGTYQEQCFCPLAEAATSDDLQRYRWPDPAWFDTSEMRPQAERIRRTHVVQCGYMAPLYFHTQLRGLEQALVDPLLEPEFTRHLLERLCDFFYRQHRAMFEACAGLIDVAQVTDDLGSQTGPLLSVEVWREFYRPHTQRFIDLCHEFGIHVFHHDDGAIRPFLPDLAEMGVEILNPIQWRCPGMEVAGLKRDFGHAFCFHGAIDNQQTLPHGTPEEVRAEVRQMIDVLAADGTGYILAPCHAIQPVTPLENILAMYDEAWQYGRRG